MALMFGIKGAACANYRDKLEYTAPAINKNNTNKIKGQRTLWKIRIKKLQHT